MNWNATERYVPSLDGGGHVSITIITTGVVAFRWIVNRMPVLAELPEYRGPRTSPRRTGAGSRQGRRAPRPGVQDTRSGD